MKNITLFLISIFCVAICTSCSKDETINCVYTPRIIDESGELSNHTKEIFTNFEYPAGVVPILFHTKEIKPLITTSSYTDNCFDSIANIIPEKKDFAKRGLLVVVSDNPRLIQIRLGSKYKTYCYLIGATSGSEYYNFQSQIAKDGIVNVLPLLLKNVCTRINELTNFVISKNNQFYFAINFIERQLEYAGTPSENFYGKWILKPFVLIVNILLGIVNNWFICLTIIFFVFFALYNVIFNFIERIFNKENIYVKIGIKILEWLLGFFFSIEITAVALVMSSGRMEDMMALKELGIPNISTLIENMSLYNHESSFFLHLLFLFLFAIYTILNTDITYILGILPNKLQREIYNREDKALKEYRKELSKSDTKKIDESEKPYTEMLFDYLGSKTNEYFILPSIACLLLPNILIYTGLIIYLCKILNLVIGPIRTIIKQLYMNKDENEEMYMNIFVIFIGILLCCLITLGFNKCISPVPERKEIDYSTINTKIINKSLLTGNYGFTIKIEERNIYGSASIVAKDDANMYELTIYGQGDPKSFPLFYDENNMTFICKDYIGNGNIHIDNKTEIIYITFNVSNETWELHK